MTNSLHFWRKLMGMNQIALARKIGVEQSIISQFENGDREPTANTWEKIATALNIPVDRLFSPPPLMLRGHEEAVVERTASAPGREEPPGKSRKARRPQGFGTINFLTPSQAKVGVQLQKTIQLADNQWDGARVWVELPCDDDPVAIRETKTEAVRYCRDFLNEEIGRIEAEDRARFNQELVERMGEDGANLSGFGEATKEPDLSKGTG